MGWRRYYLFEGREGRWGLTAVPHGYCGEMHEQSVEPAAAEAPPNDPSHVGRASPFSDATALKEHLCKLSTACGASEICVRSLRGHGPPPTASPVRRLLRRIRKCIPSSRTLPGQALRGLDHAPLSLSPSLELAPGAGRFREGARANGRSGSACPESGTGCRPLFAALRLSGKRLPILAMAPRVAGRMIARLSAWLHVCQFAR